jgi:hypothetical protein
VAILTLKSGTIGAGAIIETSGGTAIVSGTVTNGGTLFASAAGDLIEIVSGAVVNGGVAEVGDGLVKILGSSGENVSFLSSGTGGLAIADTSGHATAFKGRVSGFGGTAHEIGAQFIDLINVSSGGTITSRSDPARPRESGDPVGRFWNVGALSRWIPACAGMSGRRGQSQQNAL